MGDAGYIRRFLSENGIGQKPTRKKFNKVLTEFLDDNNLKFVRWVPGYTDGKNADVLNSAIVANHWDLFGPWVEKNINLIKLWVI